MDTLSAILRFKGIPDTVISYAAVPQRDSTSGLYDKQWKAFSQFCRTKSVHPLNSTEIVISEYLVNMFQGGAQPSTIKVHKAAILSVLCHVTPELPDSVIIKNCVRRFEVERPRTHRVLPKFDINLVLWQLLKPPFTSEDGKSDRDIPLDIFVCKVTFLLALACGKRSSEMHAFTRTPDSLTREARGGERC